MSTDNSNIRSTLIPCLRYRDAHAAIAQLGKVFGFTEKLIVPGDNNAIRHAELALGNGMIMLGSESDSNEYGRLTGAPVPGSRHPQSIYAVVPDADAVYERVRAAGMEVVMPIKDEDHGGRGFTCRDLEGHIWSVGTYDPFA